MTFKPTMEEFQNFSAYITYMEKQGAHRFGIAKVIPPAGWVPRKSNDDNDNNMLNLIIPAPILQVVSHKAHGVYQQLGTIQKSMTVREFKELSETDKYKTPDFESPDDLELKYWESIVTDSPPIYGADVSGSLTDKDINVWNISKLGTILDRVNSDYGIKIEGVNTAYLYFGMWKTTFAWHTEDMDLYSINYIHEGSSKTWYAIPPKHGRKFEKIAANLFVDAAETCPAFLRHKIVVMSPDMLKKNHVPCNKIIQKEGEIIITFPYGYHSGHNNGFNVAESTNFALTRWIEFGKKATKCCCENGSVAFSMDTFVKNYQSDMYQDWVAGQRPNEKKKCTTAPKITKCDEKKNKILFNIYARHYINLRKRQ